MAYLNRVASLLSPSIGTPSPAPSPHGSISTPPSGVKSVTTRFAQVPEAKPHVQPAPYDAAHDPAWKPFLDPNDHELRNMLNQLSPEERQLLLRKFMERPKVMAPIPPEAGPQIPMGEQGPPQLGPPL